MYVHEGPKSALPTQALSPAEPRAVLELHGLEAGWVRKRRCKKHAPQALVCPWEGPLLPSVRSRLQTLGRAEAGNPERGRGVLSSTAGCGLPTGWGQ